MNRKLILLGLCAFLLSTTLSHAAFPGLNGKIAFWRCQRIFTISPDGSNETQLTDFHSFGPAWSPDGTKIAFTGVPVDDINIFTMNEDGTNVTQVTFTSVNADPAWSPDGASIVYVEYSAPGTNIVTINADGTNRTQLTFDGAAGPSNLRPAWSPDGTKIAFVRLDGPVDNPDWDIYVMNSDGSDIQRLTDRPGRNDAPNWSPDGSLIAFDGDDGIYLMNADGTNQNLFTPTNPGPPHGPAFSPNGSRVAFSDYDYRSDIYTLGLEQTTRTRVTNSTTCEGALDPDWQPIPGQAVQVDILPRKCPNKLKTKHTTKPLKVAVAGTNTFDVSQIDTNSIRLAGIAPESIEFADATEPRSAFAPCAKLRRDGIPDLVMKFNRDALVAALGDVRNRESVSLQLTGQLLDGRPVEGSDSVLIKKK